MNRIGKVFVSPEDYDFLNHFTWKDGYTQIGAHCVPIVDFITMRMGLNCSIMYNENGDKLDCRRENLKEF